MKIVVIQLRKRVIEKWLLLLKNGGIKVYEKLLEAVVVIKTTVQEP